MKQYAEITILKNVDGIKKGQVGQVFKTPRGFVCRFGNKQFSENWLPKVIEMGRVSNPRCK